MLWAINEIALHKLLNYYYYYGSTKTWNLEFGNGNGITETEMETEMKTETETETESARKGSKQSIWKKNGHDKKINKQIKELITLAEETAVWLEESILMNWKTFHTTSGNEWKFSAERAAGCRENHF